MTQSRAHVIHEPGMMRTKHMQKTVFRKHTGRRTIKGSPR